MIILESKKYNVYLFEDTNSIGCFEYIVKYGLEVTRSGQYIADAVRDFSLCLHHAMECNGDLIEEA